MDTASNENGDRPSALEVYRYIGCSASPTSEVSALGRLPWRPDLEMDGEPSMAALAVFVQSMAGVNVFPITPMVVPTSVVVHLRDHAEGIEELEGHSEVVRAGRTSAVTSATIVSASDPSRLVAHALATWAFPGGPVEPRGQNRGASAASYEGTYSASLVDWLAPVDHAEGLAVHDVRPAVAEPVALGGTESRTMHGGPIQILNEASARTHARSSAGSQDVALLDFATYFLAPARDVPLVARAETVARLGDDLDVRVELRRPDARLCSFSEGRFRIR